MHILTFIESAGVIVLTFFGSYQTVAIANGYFGSWAAFFFSVVAFTQVSPGFEYQIEKALESSRRPLLFLIAASAVEMGAAIGPCSPQSSCNSYNAFAVCLGSISCFIGICMLLLSFKISAKHMKFMSIFLILWWTVGKLFAFKKKCVII